MDTQKITEVSVLDIGGGVVLYILSAWPSLAQTRLEFDILLTDGGVVWGGESMTPPPLHALAPQQWLQSAREALTDSEKSFALSSYSFEHEVQEGLIRIEWSATYSDARCYSCQILLRPEINQKASMRKILDKMSTGFKDLSHSVLQLQETKEQLAKQLIKTQEELERVVERARAREEEHYVKFTLLLNSRRV